MAKKRVIVFFTELSDYILNVFEHWVEVSDVELYIFRTPVNQNEAPFEFSLNNEAIYFFNREAFDTDLLERKVKEIAPHMILCAGWSDKGYLKSVAQFSGKIPTVLMFDNQWFGTPKQYLASLLSRFTLSKIFDYVWVPGEPQVAYARRLGFKRENIVTGFYVANRSNFDRDIVNPEGKFSKRFIFLGRYVAHKGIMDLWQAFIELQDEEPNDWELWCIGTGSLMDERVEHSQIKHIGFVQPKDLKAYIAEGGVFVLPSHFEAWGVAVHEFAYAGFPLLVSDAVGAGTQFVKEGSNGYLFQHKNKTALKEKMKMFMALSEKELKTMGNESYALASLVTKESWVESITAILEADSQ